MSVNVGQDAVCIKNHSQGVVKEGDVRMILAKKKSNCGCAKWVVDIGKPTSNKFPHGALVKCGVCGDKLNYVADGIWWINEALFAPLDELADITELTEILENTKPFGVK